MEPIRILRYQSPEYQQQVALRTAVLRQPLGLQFSAADLEKDGGDILFGYFDGENNIIGCCQLVIREKGVFQLRQMAVDPLYQGRHIGRKLIQFAEDYARAHGGTRIALHARKVAMEFYRKLGYQVEGAEFTEVGIPHFSMYKDLD